MYITHFSPKFKHTRSTESLKCNVQLLGYYFPSEIKKKKKENRGKINTLTLLDLFFMVIRGWRIKTCKECINHAHFCNIFALLYENVTEANRL